MGESTDEEALRAAVSALYAVPPAEFVATRKEWVARLRSEGRRDVARQVGGLRRPSVSAAAINALVRAEDPVVGMLRDLGTRLRHAQSAMDAAGLAGLRGARDDVLAAWVEAARKHGPATLTGSTEAEVRDTAIAALADAEATEVVLSGALTRALAYSGFGEVDVADAVARTSTGVVLTRIDGGAGTDVTSADAATDDGDAASLDDAGAASSDDERHEGAESPGEPRAAELDRLRAELEEAEGAVESARETRRERGAARERARSRQGVAASGVAQARRLLEQAEQHASVAQREVEQADAAATEADQQLATARARRDAARARLEQAEDG